MATLNSWRSFKLEGHGIRQVSVARTLLTVRGTELNRSTRDAVEDLLNYAEDFRRVLPEKRLLARTIVARQYDRCAGEALHKIEDILAPPLRSSPAHQLVRAAQPALLVKKRRGMGNGVFFIVIL